MAACPDFAGKWAGTIEGIYRGESYTGLVALKRGSGKPRVQVVTTEHYKGTYEVYEDTYTLEGYEKFEGQCIAVLQDPSRGIEVHMIFTGKKVAEFVASNGALELSLRGQLRRVYF